MTSTARQSVAGLHALFVHGMGRSPLSGLPLLHQLRRAGLRTGSFGYVVSIENFAKIRTRLLVAITALAERGDYVLIGHSLGGVLIRAALQRLPRHVRQPHHVFLLGSPVMPSRLAQTLGGNPVFRMMTGDCGQLLRSALRMAEVEATTVPTTAIIGIRGLTGKRAPFGDERNDGVVSLSEVSADWLTDQVQLPVIHTFLPSSSLVAEVVLRRLADRARDAATP